MMAPGSIHRIVTTGLWALAALGLVIGAATARVVSSGEKEIALSTAGLRAGDAHAAAEHARRAAGWYAPGAPHVRVAYERLLALGTAAEGLGDRELALFAFRGVRTAALETRWLVIPYEDDLEKANRAIARLAADAPRAPGLRAEPPLKIEREQLDALARDEAPRTGWVVALVAAALAWAAGAVWMVRRAVSPEGAIRWQRALPGAAITGAGVLLWLLAIWRA
ncbi:Hypothetical protein A7982_10871 [Minicystis rosea]|nr:Hypothetical protein A7982_10871 [Minicystis rosea]